MSDKMALKLAIDLVHVPSQVRLFRSEPLPDDVVMLLRIAAGDTEMERMAVALADRSREVVQRAAEFFIEQILFFPNADSYRVLGATPQASTAELRRNVALLLRWLHPDVDPRGERSIFVGKVTAAWNDLKTPERRAAYDAARRIPKDRSESRPKVRSAHSWRRRHRRPLAAVPPYQGGDFTNKPVLYARRKAGLLRRVLSILFDKRSYQ